MEIIREHPGNVFVGYGPEVPGERMVIELAQVNWNRHSPSLCFTCVACLRIVDIALTTSVCLVPLAHRHIWVVLIAFLQAKPGAKFGNALEYLLISTGAVQLSACS